MTPTASAAPGLPAASAPAEPKPAEPTLAALLTAHELRVSALVASGLTNRAIAERLGVSPKTVEYHLGMVFARIGVRSRVELAVRVAADARVPAAA
jgi:DNA-binding CsgD family transcriptional regulator